MLTLDKTNNFQSPSNNVVKHKQSDHHHELNPQHDIELGSKAKLELSSASNQSPVSSTPLSQKSVKSLDYPLASAYLKAIHPEHHAMIQEIVHSVAEAIVTEENKKRSFKNYGGQCMSLIAQSIAQNLKCVLHQKDPYIAQLTSAIQDGVLQDLQKSFRSLDKSFIKNIKSSISAGVSIGVENQSYNLKEHLETHIQSQQPTIAKTENNALAPEAESSKVDFNQVVDGALKKGLAKHPLANKDHEAFAKDFLTKCFDVKTNGGAILFNDTRVKKNGVGDYWASFVNFIKSICGFGLQESQAKLIKYQAMKLVIESPYFNNTLYASEVLAMGHCIEVALISMIEQAGGDSKVKSDILNAVGNGLHGGFQGLPIEKMPAEDDQKSVTAADRVTVRRPTEDHAKKMQQLAFGYRYVNGSRQVRIGHCHIAQVGHFIGMDLQFGNCTGQYSLGSHHNFHQMITEKDGKIFYTNQLNQEIELNKTTFRDYQNTDPRIYDIYDNPQNDYGILNRHLENLVGNIDIKNKECPCNEVDDFVMHYLPENLKNCIRPDGSFVVHNTNKDTPVGLRYALVYNKAKDGVPAHIVMEFNGLGDHFSTEVAKEQSTNAVNDQLHLKKEVPLAYRTALEHAQELNRALDQYNKDHPDKSITFETFGYSNGATYASYVASKLKVPAQVVNGQGMNKTCYNDLNEEEKSHFQQNVVNNIIDGDWLNSKKMISNAAPYHQVVYYHNLNDSGEQKSLFKCQEKDLMRSAPDHEHHLGINEALIGVSHVTKATTGISNATGAAAHGVLLSVCEEGSYGVEFVNSKSGEIDCIAYKHLPSKNQKDIIEKLNVYFLPPKKSKSKQQSTPQLEKSKLSSNSSLASTPLDPTQPNLQPTSPIDNSSYINKL